MTQVFADTSSLSYTYVYDAAANLIDDGLLTYRYDLFGHLAQVDRKITTGTEPVATYYYDALGRRIRKVVQNSGTLDTYGSGDYFY